MATHGIRAGTSWIDAAGREVQVVQAQDNYVAFRVAGEPASLPLWHAVFRALFKPNRERCVIRSRFSMSLVNLAHAHIYFDPVQRRIIARRADRDPVNAREAAQGAPAVPIAAFYVGTYTHPVSFNDFESDLIDVLDRHGLGRLK